MKRKVVSSMLVCLLLGIILVVSGCDSNEKQPAQEPSKEETVVKTPFNSDRSVSKEHIDAMHASDTLVVSSMEEVFSYNMPEGASSGQGGCTDGKYYYQAFIELTGDDELTNKCTIQKIDMETGEVIKTSEPIQTNHSNDITYNSKLGCLVVVHNKPCYNCVTYIDPDTLEHIETVPTDYFYVSMDYNASKDKYVAGMAFSQNFRILDSDFNAVTDVLKASSKTKSSTMQGMSSDDEFIYFGLFNPNVISVYDWEGNFVTLIKTDVPNEPENISVIDGEIYITSCRNGRGTVTVYKLSGFVPEPAKAEK